MGEARTLLIACGALARETLAVIEANRLTHLDLTCIPALLHNRPERIADGGARARSASIASSYGRILVLYGDCGTGGELDRVLAEEGRRADRRAALLFVLCRARVCSTRWPMPSPARST